MIEIVILNHMASVLDVAVALEKPDPAPDRYVLLEKTGSGKSNRLPSSTFAFQSHAPTLYEAALLNDKVKEAAEGLINLGEISKVSLNSDYHFTDPSTKTYRYQAIYDLYHY